MGANSTYLFVLYIWVALFCKSEAIIQIPLPSGNGPESIVFDKSGRGPYTGISDGRILRWDGLRSGGWVNFAVTSPYCVTRTEDCIGSTARSLERKCGRPLGLQLNKTSGDIYVVDAYHGLMVIGPEGGRARPLASSVDGVPFRFLNGLDIDQDNGDIYFTDTSRQFERREYGLVISTDDSTGRLMKYDSQTKQVTVLLRGLFFANGVAVSKDKSYVLVTETTRNRIQRYWLSGAKNGTSEIWVELPGSPDNIKRNSEGNFWVAINHALAVKVDRDGLIIDVIDVTKVSHSISEVQEHQGRLFLGSVLINHVGVY
ncbi:Strictosidine synthase 1 [Acorus gramineus]|uniref:Strictosidine synthase 1 n=1 Tax=Acorus gramineus TaxID=55184 RepID=A0AAV9BC40_ACOGR|nr:Strictosidine synthase 1 [Acorus gramineus]